MRIGIISDIHCDIRALETALEKLKKDVDQVVCAGDLYLQYRFSNEISEMIQAWEIQVVRGNHDTAILSSAGIILRKSGQIRQDNLEHLQRMPLVLEWSVDGKNFVMTHTSPMDPTGGVDGGRAGVYLPGEGDRLSQQSPMNAESGRVREVSVYRDIAKLPNSQLPEGKADVLIVGHTHMPLVTKVGETLLINPGSLGQPRDPDKPTTRTYAILDTYTWEATIQGFHQALGD